MQTIKDPLLKPYYIGRDSHCYTVYEVITPSGERLRTEGSKGKIMKNLYLIILILEVL